MDWKLFFAGINARWFYNQSIEEIKRECVEITTRLDSNVSSTGPKDFRAVNSALATIPGDRKTIYVYTSCYLAQYIGTNKGNYHAEFLKLFPFFQHTLGSGTLGDVFESDLRLHLEQSHNVRGAQVAIIGPDNMDDVMVVLGKRCGYGGKVVYTAGQIDFLRSPPSDPVAYQRTYLSATTVEKVPQWFIPESNEHPFLDFMILMPQQNDT